MKKLICLLLAALSASAATITGPVGDISGNPYSPRIEFWPLSTPFSSGNTNIVGPKKEKQVVNGNFSIDLLPGRYLVKFPPTTNYFTIVVPTNGSSYALSEVATNLPAMAGIAQTAWILENSGVGTNTTFYGTITMPASGVNGYVWTATNNTGAGFWVAGVSAASVAAKADTNNTTIWNLDARGFQTDSITNLAGNVFALFASGGGFYFYDPNAGNPFMAGDDTTVSLYANAVEVFAGKEDYTEVMAQNTTNKLHISADGNIFTGPIAANGVTNTATTDALIYADAAGKYGEAAAANVYGLWTGTGTYMTRFGTNANVVSGETNLQRVLQVGSNANGENATNFGTISATNATFENFNVENQYTTNHYVTSLTSGRVVLVTTGGQLTDHSGFTYNTGTGNLGVQGSVTAESFAGDGSAITDLNASEISSGTLAAARLGHEYLSNGHTASITFSNASTILRGTLQVAGAGVFTNDVTARAALKVTGPAQITNTIYQSFAVNELATTGNATNFAVDFYATNTQTILATGNVYIASLDNLASGRWKQLIITNVFKASSNITAYVQTNLLWLGPTNGYALGASPMHTNRAYPVTNVLVLSLQAVGSTAPSVLGYGIQSSP